MDLCRSHILRWPAFSMPSSGKGGKDWWEWHRAVSAERSQEPQPLDIRALLGVVVEVHGCDLAHRLPALPRPPRGGWRALCSHPFHKRVLKGTLARALLQKLSAERREASPETMSRPLWYLNSCCLESTGGSRIQHTKSRSAVSATRHDGRTSLKTSSSTLGSNLFSDTHPIFVLCLQQSSFAVSALCPGEGGMRACTCFYVWQRALRWSRLRRHGANPHTVVNPAQKENGLPRYWTSNLNHKGRQQALFQEQVAFCS